MSTTSRRAVLAGAATLPALAVPAAASSLAPDPIFAAIEAHRSAWDSNDGEEDALIDQWFARVLAAEEAMVDTTPTSIAGVIALMDYAADHEVTTGGAIMQTREDEASGREVSWNFMAYRSMAKALRNMAVQS